MALKEREGKIYGISTGPGASDLLTLRAINTLKEVDIIYAPFSKMRGDSVAFKIVEPFIQDRTEIKQRTFAMSHDTAKKEAIWQEVVREMEEDVLCAKKVAFISLGDAMLYSTWVSLLERISPDIPVEIIPGITSFSLIAAHQKYPLAMEEESLKIISCTADDEILEEAISGTDNLVLMKVTANFPLVHRLLKKYNILSQAILISNASLQKEACVCLESVDPNIKLPYFSTILLNRSWKK